MVDSTKNTIFAMTIIHLLCIRKAKSITWYAGKNNFSPSRTVKKLDYFKTIHSNSVILSHSRLYFVPTLKWKASPDVFSCTLPFASVNVSIVNFFFSEHPWNGTLSFTIPCSPQRICWRFLLCFHFCAFVCEKKQ